MEVRARKCDRCGKYYEVEDMMPDIKMQRKISETTGGTYSYKAIDLCPNCIREIKTMLEANR